MPDTHAARQPRGQDVPAAVKAAACRSWLGVEALISRYLGKTLSERAYRTFLFELYLADLEKTDVFQSYFAAGEAPANAHRRSARLARLGALTRTPDETDHRRVALRLAPRVRQAMDHIAIGVMEAHHGFSRRPHSATGYAKAPSDNVSATPGSGDALAIAGDGIVLHKGKLVAGGRITLPLDLRRSLGLHNGDTVVMTIQGDEIRIRTARSALRQVQQRLQSFAPRGGRISDELIAERHQESRHD